MTPGYLLADSGSETWLFLTVHFYETGTVAEACYLPVLSHVGAEPRHAR